MKHDKPLLYPDITYSFYKTYARLFEITVEEVPLDDAMRIRISDYDRPCGAIILANPNAPTGIALPLSDIEALVASHPDQVVVVDEAYVDFGAETAASLIPRYDNLLVVHTFSKSRSLAGLRVGFALGQRPLIEALERMKDSFNSYPLDTLAQAAATAAVDDRAWFEQTRTQIIANREMVTKALQDAVSKSCRHPPTSSSPAIPRIRGQIWHAACASAPCWCATSPSPGFRTISG